MSDSVVRLSFRRFCNMVEKAVAELPAEFRDRLENVSIEVIEEPSREDWEEAGGPEGDDDHLLGLFQGVFRTEQEAGVAYPNRIKIFRRPLEDFSENRRDLFFNIQETVIHELGHHFGMTEEDLEPYERSIEERRRIQNDTGNDDVE